jgi:hypothetical protein
MLDRRDFMARRAMAESYHAQQNALDVVNAELLGQRRGKGARRKRAAENVAKLLVQPANAHVLKAKGRRKNILAGAALGLLEGERLVGRLVDSKASKRNNIVF